MIINSAYVFPGQGSQSVGMLSELAENYELIKQTFDLASDRLGYDLWLLTQQGPEATLNQTVYTQAAMLVADVAVFKVLEQLGAPSPVIMAGHSLGEYAALVCAAALSLADAAELVAKRGKLMQDTLPIGSGAMAAIIGLTDEQVNNLCKEASQASSTVTPANYNAIGQVVIAGHLSAVEKALTLAEALGARMAKIIPVSVPCHCPLLTEAAELFEESLGLVPFSAPQIAVISNVDLSIYKTPLQMRTLLKEQLYRPVRWVETIQLMKNQAVDYIVECGPGKILSGLVKRIDKTLVVASTNDNKSVEQTLLHWQLNK